ncbi:MAG: hypothetical protein Q9Q40_15015, partial [Acidobacteriota bacterium]|nr:hypothetical protein [Acidobacteriota bacterium]
EKGKAPYQLEAFMHGVAEQYYRQLVEDLATYKKAHNHVLDNWSLAGWTVKDGGGQLVLDDFGRSSGQWRRVYERGSETDVLTISVVKGDVQW